MKRSLLIAYQLFIGLMDTSTGFLLIATPALALQSMKLHAAEDTLVYISYLGVFVLSVGLACLYGGLLAVKGAPADKLDVVWLLTAITRGLVAVFVVVKVASGAVEPGWSTVAFTDGTFTLIQSVGLARGWLRNVRE
jgi:hypothetical protein